MIGSTTLDDDAQEFAFDTLSEDVKISKQTLVRWADRGLIDAALDWDDLGRERRAPADPHCAALARVPARLRPRSTAKTR